MRSKEQAKPKARPRPLLGAGLPAVLAVVDALREHPAAEQVSDAGSVRRRRETFRDLDVIATATDAKALIEAFTSFDWVVEVVAKGGTKATVISQDGLRFDLRVRAARVLRQPAPALHRLEEPQRGHARGGGAPRALHLRVRDHRGRVGRGAHLPHRGGALRVARLPVHPARAAGGRGRARGGPEGRVAGARRGGGHPRRPARAHDVVGGRQEHDGGDGARREGSRLLVPRNHRPLALPPRGEARGASPRSSRR